MGALLLLLVCVVLGALVARFARTPDGLVPSLNWWVLNVALPALVLALIPSLHFRSQLWFLVAVMWLTFGGAWLLIAGVGRWRGWSRGRIGALVLVSALGNTSFMGYPLIHALYGDQGLQLAVVADQLGSFVLLTSLGIVVASIYAGRAPGARGIVRNIFTFPAFLALLLGVLVNMLGGWPGWMDKVLLPIGHTLTPLALFSVGLQLQLRLARHQVGPTLLGLSWKLLLAPLLCWVLAMICGVHGLVMRVGVLQAAMAPMVSGAILADDYGLEPELSNTVLGIGILLSLATVPLANLLLG